MLALFSSMRGVEDMAKKKSSGGGCLALLVLIVAIWAVSSALEFVARHWVIVALLLLLVTAPRWTRPIRKNWYFKSEEFRARKAAIASLVAEHNEVAEYVAEIRERGSFDLDAASTGRYAHLATSMNTSFHNYKRDRNVAHFSEPNVHNCSLGLVQKAQMEPLKYLMKYFGVSADEESLAMVEAMNASVASLEQAIANLNQREMELTMQVDPPEFIKRHYMAEFMAQTGTKLSPIEVPYPLYRFEYVSAGGNSSQHTDVQLNGETLDALVEELSRKIRWRKSVAGQRSLMTSRLRMQIKERDRYTCQQYGVSVTQEPHLLIEVDHIVPVSRGGMTTPQNLQALCWRCNRVKSNKLA